MTDPKRTLNLDELFGQAQPIVVKWASQSHYLRRPEEMGPRDVVLFDRLNGQLTEMRELAGRAPEDDALDEQRANAWEHVLDDMLRLVGPTLLKVDPPLTFVMKTRVLEFYIQQIAPAAAAEGDAPGDGEKKAPIGETSLAS